MQKLLGFMPDADVTTLGILTSCTNIIPYEIGMKGAPTGATPNGVPVLSAECTGAAVVTRTDSTRRILAGTANTLQELLAGVWTDRSSGAYTSGTDTRWQFCQFGDATLATNLSDAMQRSVSGAFSNLSAPKAKIIFTVGSFVMALNTDDTNFGNTYGAQTDRWWCCATYDDTSWTPSLVTMATTGRLVSTPGAFTAGGKLGEYAVAYKERAIYLGQFVGAPDVWDWKEVISGEAGCIGPEAWCDIGGMHFFVGNDNLYLFDGSRPQPLGVGEVRQWFFDNSDASYRYRSKCIYDKQENRVFLFYPAAGESVCTQALVWHIKSRQWGAMTVAPEAVLNFISAGTTIDELDGFSASIEGLTDYAFDSQFWLTGGRSMAYFDAAHQMKSLTGPCAASALTTGDIGDDDSTTLLSRVRLRFVAGFVPTAASMTTYAKMNEGEALTIGTTSSLNDGKFDALQSARFHRLAFAFTGDHRITGMNVQLQPDGGY